MPKIPCTLHRTLSFVCLGFSIGSRIDLRSAWIQHYLKNLQYMEPQEGHISFLRHLNNRLASDIRILVTGLSL